MQNLDITNQANETVTPNAVEHSTPKETLHQNLINLILPSSFKLSLIEDREQVLKSQTQPYQRRHLDTHEGLWSLMMPSDTLLQHVFTYLMKKAKEFKLNYEVEGKDWISNIAVFDTSKSRYMPEKFRKRNNLANIDKHLLNLPLTLFEKFTGSFTPLIDEILRDTGVKVGNRRFIHKYEDLPEYNVMSGTGINTALENTQKTVLMYLKHLETPEERDNRMSEVLLLAAMENGVQSERLEPWMREKEKEWYKKEYPYVQRQWSRGHWFYMEFDESQNANQFIDFVQKNSSNLSSEIFDCKELLPAWEKYSESTIVEN